MQLLLPSVAEWIKDFVLEEKRYVMQYRRIPIPRKILHKGGNVRYKWYYTFPRRVLLRKTSQLGFRPAKSFAVAFLHITRYPHSAQPPKAVEVRCFRHRENVPASVAHPAHGRAKRL